MVNDLSDSQRARLRQIGERIDGSGDDASFKLVLLTTGRAFVLGKRFDDDEDAELLPDEALAELIDSYTDDGLTLLALIPSSNCPAPLREARTRLDDLIRGNALEASYRLVALQAADGIMLGKRHADDDEPRVINQNWLSDIVDHYSTDMRAFLTFIAARDVKDR